MKARLQVQSVHFQSQLNPIAARLPQNGSSVRPLTPFSYRGIFSALRDIFRTEGLHGLYRGFGITALGSAPAGCLYYTTYEYSRNQLTDLFGREPSWSYLNNNFGIHFVSGMVAETVSCVLWVPIDVIKERMQIQKYRQQAVPSGEKQLVYYRNGVDAMRKIVRNEGILGFYRGYGATIMSFGPFSAFYFMFYEQFKGAAMKVLQAKREKDLNFTVFVGCSCAAGALASFITNPLDLVKLRLQVQRQSTASASPHQVAKNGKQLGYKHLLDGLMKVARYEGAAGMFQGVTARMAFHAPSTAIGMTIFEVLKISYHDLLYDSAEST